MSEIKLVWRTDVHMSDRAPSSRVDDWTETVFDKLGQVRDVAKAVGAAAILDGGDFFHIKSPTRNSHETVRRVMDHHSVYGIPVFCTPGNHDAVYGDYSLLGQQPLGVLFSSGTFKRLYDEYEVYFADGVAYPYNRKADTWPKGGIPEEILGRGSERYPIVRVVGIPYHGTTYDMDRFTSIERGEEDVLICVAHVLASQKGGTMFEGEDIVRYSDLVDTAPDVYLFGHWHKDQGVEEIGGKTFVNIGSLTRGALSQDEVQRRPACAILTCTYAGVEVQTVRLKVKPAEEVFDVEKRARQVRQQNEMDAFVTKIRESLIEVSEEKDVREAIRGSEDVPEEVRNRALHYLELADG
jgi:exonuclease SbcD